MRYVVTQYVTVAEGLLGLTPEQADARAYNLTDCGDGLYRVRGPVNFKRGEVVAFPEGLPRGVENFVEPEAAPESVEEPQAAPEPVEKPEAQETAPRKRRGRG